jgi:SPP1 gp7 family putative phage head morphogenesis protein
LHDGKLKPEDLNQEIITRTYNDLAEGAKKGYGKDWIKFPKDGKGTLPNELKKNIYTFSGAKTYAQLEQINQLLFDKDGKLRPFNEFAVLAKKVNRQYNVNYLQAEYQTARTAAQMAEKWERLQETKDLFPNLKYRSVGDSRVRPEHERLNGIIKPIDDDFWSRYYPPLDWRCRCDVVATAEDATNDKEDDLPKPQFKGNVGKDKEIFTAKGTFFKLLNTNENAVRNVELSKLNAPIETVYKSKSGKKLEASIFADEVDLKDNVTVAIVLVEKVGLNIQIRSHLNGHLVKGYKNPEYLVDGKIAERKAPESKNYSNILSKANKQECEVVVIDLSVNKDSIEKALIKVDGILKFNVHPFIKTVYFVSSDKKKVEVYKRKKQPKK